MKLSNLIDHLRALHAEHLAHRDIKPDNILVEPRTGKVVIADFGTVCNSV